MLITSHNFLELYHFSQSVSCLDSFSRPLTQLDINARLRVSLRVKPMNVLLWWWKKKTRLARHICPQLEHASRGLWHGLHSPAHDALSFLRYTCRHRALNPLLVAICVRCALEQRCWRISRNAILQGGKMGATWGQREGNVRTVRRFTFLEAESEHFRSELGVRQESTGPAESWSKAISTEWPVRQAAPEREISLRHCCHYLQKKM